MRSRKLSRELELQMLAGWLIPVSPLIVADPVHASLGLRAVAQYRWQRKSEGRAT
jgi:hypothetical protein